MTYYTPLFIQLQISSSTRPEVNWFPTMWYFHPYWSAYTATGNCLHFLSW